MAWRWSDMPWLFLRHHPIDSTRPYPSLALRCDAISQSSASTRWRSLVDPPMHPRVALHQLIARRTAWLSGVKGCLEKTGITHRVRFGNTHSGVAVQVRWAHSGTVLPQSHHFGLKSGLVILRDMVEVACDGMSHSLQERMERGADGPLSEICQKNPKISTLCLE